MQDVAALAPPGYAGTPGGAIVCYHPTARDKHLEGVDVEKRFVAEGFVVTSDVVPFYGEAVLSEEDVRRVYETYSTQPVPMFANHNPAQVLDAETRLVECDGPPPGRWACG